MNDRLAVWRLFTGLLHQVGALCCCKGERPLSGLETTPETGTIWETGLVAKVNDRLAVWRHHVFHADLSSFLSVAKVNDRLAVWRHEWYFFSQGSALVAKVNDRLAVWRPLFHHSIRNGDAQLQR